MSANQTINQTNDFKSYMNSYQKLCDIPKKIWTGSAKEKFISDTENFYSEYFSVITNQLDLYQTALEKYDEYCIAEQNYNAACSEYENATTEEEKANASSKMERYSAIMSALRQEINSYLNEIIGKGFASSGLSTSLSKGLSAQKIIDNIPAGLGDVFTYMGWQCITSKTSRQYRLMEAIGGVDSHFDSEGFGRINGRYVIACAQTYGEVGDYVDFVQKNGNVIKCVIGDIKSSGDPGYSQWGHKDGKNIVEFVVDKNTWYGENMHVNPGTSSFHSDWKDEIVKAINYGSYYDNPEFTG